MTHNTQGFRLHRLLILLIGVAMAACDVLESGSSRQAGTMRETVVDDRAIAVAVKAALRADSSLSPDAFEVVATEGAVELGGLVDDQAQIDRAMALAFVVPGVRSIRSRARLVDPPHAGSTHADDRRITASVMEDLQADARIRRLGIRVVTVRGEVLLSGLVDQQTQIDSALKVARAVNGVREVRHVMHIRKQGPPDIAVGPDAVPVMPLRATAYR